MAEQTQERLANYEERQKGEKKRGVTFKPLLFTLLQAGAEVQQEATTPPLTNCDFDLPFDESEELGRGREAFRGTNPIRWRSADGLSC